MKHLNKGEIPTKTIPTKNLKGPNNQVGDYFAKKDLNKGLKGFGNNLKAWQKE